MLKRKMEEELKKWKDDPDHKPLILKGCRQCGKTYSVLEFSRKNYDSVIYLNFLENPDYRDIFSGSLEVSHLVMMMSALSGPGVQFIPGKTVIILDEIQECPEARTALKFFKLDGRFDVIATGSLLGVKGYGMPRSVPVGYETVMTMRPLDFEEFLWAKGMDEALINLLSACLEEEKPVPLALHHRMRQLLLEYTVTGGMPEVVQDYVNHGQMNRVLQLQRDIIRSYEDDMVKYAENRDKSKIRECFQSIPRQLSRENKKFQYALIKKGGRTSEFTGSLQWIEDAGIIVRCYNLNLPELPLDGNAMDSVFKVYMADTGLFISMLEDGTQMDVLKGNLFGYKGAIFENLVADMLSKMGRKLYYFHKDSGLEVDFVIRYKGEAALLEVKASSGNTKSTRIILKHSEKYHVTRAIKLGDYNVGRSERILTLPHYMGFLLRQV
ncbi:ATP-binding protein [Dialister sp.]|uniref:ATP-binding protein n=1 Tax=Dialister sp. TaxID=1955814 RepID=UPI002E81AAA1|nr:AAA family ATPase [Dialister sp.]MEE3453645.1 AAA family ATPase [Dialister sp.]